MPDKFSFFWISWKLFVCIGTIWTTTDILVEILENIVAKFNFTHAFVGMTILSWGTNVPAMFNVAYSMKAGYVEMSINSIIAGDIHTILIGLGSSWFVYNIKYDKEIVLDHSIGFMKYIIFVYLVFMVTLLAFLYNNKMKFNNSLAIFLFFYYFCFITMVCILTL